MHTLLPYSDDDDAQAEASRLHKELIEQGQEDKLPRWGKIWVRGGKVIVVMPLHPLDEFSAPPVLFIDETLNVKENLFLFGALAFRPIHAILTVARHVQNLVTLAQVHNGFWAPCSPPPRLHLRELNHPAARLKTPWKHVPRKEIELLFKTFVPAIREYSGLRLISPIQLESFEKALRHGAPDQSQIQIEQLSIQFASMTLHRMLADSNLEVEELEVIADHNHTAVRVGSAGRQATLHFLDCLIKANSALPMKCSLVWDKNARYSSKFPSSFSLECLEDQGYCLRTLVEAVGLQFVDAYIGLWRVINSEKRPYFGITSEDLGIQTITNVTWAHS